MLQNLYITLKDRGFISVSGIDKEKFIQSLITNDIIKVTEDNSIHSLMLTPKGKFLYGFFIIKNNNSYLLDCYKDYIPEIIKKLSMYKLRSNVEIKEKPDIESFAFTGKNINEIFGLEKEGETIRKDENIYYTDPRSRSMGIRGVIINKELLYNRDNLKEGSLEDFEYLRIRNTIASCEKDMEATKSFPHKYNFDKLNSISYDKGCYIGQEITARMHYKGVSKESLYTVISKEKTDAKKGDEILLNNKPAGYLSSYIDNIGVAVLDNQEVNILLNTEQKKYKLVMNNQEIEILLN